jgi:hypothetical protein
LVLMRSDRNIADPALVNIRLSVIIIIFLDGSLNP